jgi:hypothetical protein
MKKIRLTESEFHSLVKRMVMEVQDQMVEPEMSENIFGDIGKGLKKFRKGYGSKEERDEMKDEFMDDLERMEDKMMDMGFDETQYGNEQNWQEEKEDLIDQAEENDFMGSLGENIYVKKFKIKYTPGKTGAQHMVAGLKTGAGAGVRSGMSKGTANENRRTYRRF